jgi:hypothetical protein
LKIYSLKECPDLNQWWIRLADPRVRPTRLFYMELVYNTYRYAQERAGRFPVHITSRMGVE